MSAVIAGRHGSVRAPRRSRAGVNGARSSTRITEVQRTRMLGAAMRVVGEVGYGGMSVSRVTSRAGVSRRTFYEQFEDREDCFLALFDEALARASGVARDAVTAAVVAEQGDRWCERVRAGLFALLALVEDDPAVGSLLVVDALGVGPRVLERRASALGALKTIVDEGRVEAKKARGAPSPPPPLTAEGVLGAVLSVIHARLLEQGRGSAAENGSSRRSSSFSLTGLLNPLMGMIVLPYLGQAAAARELERPKPKVSRAPKTPRVPKEPAKDPLRGLEMRLTSRTLLVLSAIAERPGASNRQIADVAGVHDQGQISKLLGRLQRLGLIANYGAGQVRGASNAWGLTPKGQEIETALSPPSRR